jgi:hypothetical protein
MKTYEYLKEMYSKINSLLGEIDNEVTETIKKIKKENNKIIIDEKIKLLKIICDGENLDFNNLKNKYLNEKEKKCIKENINIFEVSNETLLDTIEIDGKTYFYENKEKGIIYDRKTNKPVGIIKNKEPIFD